jgi:hypothetical protein
MEDVFLDFTSVSVDQRGSLFDKIAQNKTGVVIE